MSTTNSPPVAASVGQPGSGAPWTLAALTANGGTGFVVGSTVITVDSPAGSGANIWDGNAWHQALSLTSILLSPGGFVYESSSDALTAKAGGGQASALQLTSELNRITTVATAGDSVKLPASLPGLTLIVTNHGLNPMQVFGFGTDQIDDVATATGVSQMPNSTVIYACYTAGNWYTEGLASGFVRGASLQTFSSQDNITAHAGGGQASATPLPAMMNRVVTVATAGDSTILPVSVSGQDITVTNANASNSVNVFPQGTDMINALGASAAFALGPTKSVQFICYTAGQWHTLPLVP